MNAPTRRVIWKYVLKFPNLQGKETLLLPQGAQPLTVQMQGKNICLWVSLIQSCVLAPRTFQLVLTGEESNPQKEAYVGTVQDDDLVYHIFEIL